MIKKAKGKSPGYDFSSDLKGIKEAVTEAAQHAKGKANDLISDSVAEAKGRSTDLKDHVESYVGEQPFKSIGIALLCGIFLGIIMRK
jgi:ElaB/YqjD/DUF883 family membrane-anchored ribosome-binding protein